MSGATPDTARRSRVSALRSATPCDGETDRRSSAMRNRPEHRSLGFPSRHTTNSALGTPSPRHIPVPPGPAPRPSRAAPRRHCPALRTCAEPAPTAAAAPRPSANLGGGRALGRRRACAPPPPPRPLGGKQVRALPWVGVGFLMVAVASREETASNERHLPHTPTAKRAARSGVLR